MSEMVELSLAWLLTPLPVQTFLDDFWAATHHHIRRGDPGYFDRLLPGPSAGDRLLEQLRPGPDAVRLVKGDESRDSDTYRLADGSLDLARVRSDLADGSRAMMLALPAATIALTVRPAGRNPGRWTIPEQLADCNGHRL